MINTPAKIIAGDVIYFAYYAKTLAGGVISLAGDVIKITPPVNLLAGYAIILTGVQD